MFEVEVNVKLNGDLGSNSVLSMQVSHGFFYKQDFRHPFSETFKMYCPF